MVPIATPTSIVSVYFGNSAAKIALVVVFSLSLDLIAQYGGESSVAWSFVLGLHMSRVCDREACS